MVDPDPIASIYEVESKRPSLNSYQDILDMRTHDPSFTS